MVYEQYPVKAMSQTGTDIPVVAITGRGIMRFNQCAKIRFGLTDITHVNLFY